MSNINDKLDTDTWRYADKSMNWYGWGSPVGLGLFLLSLAGTSAIIARIVALFTHHAG